MECLSQCLWNVVGVGDHEVVLGHWHGDAADIGFLEGIGTQQATSDLAGDGNHGNGVQVCISDWGNQVGCAWARGCNADANASSNLRVAGCCVACALLVAHQDVAHLCGGIERVIHR